MLLPDDDVRTLTPLEWRQDGGTAFLIYMHGNHPLARWARAVEPRDVVRFVGPSRSLGLPPGPLTLLGDETSIAVAASYARMRPGQVRVVLEVDAGSSLDEALAALGLGDAEVVSRGPGRPRGEALAAALTRVDGAVGITGGAELVQRARARVRELGSSAIKTRAYWIEGRTGLD